MSTISHASRRGLASLAGLAVAATGLTLASATPANAVSDGLVISEVYGGGGNSGAEYKSDFIEISNPTDDPISVAGWSVQYRSYTNGGTGVTPLSGSVPAGGHYLVKEADGSGGTTDLPEPDATGTLAMSATHGIAFLAKDTTSPVTLTAGAAQQPDAVVDLVGYGDDATVFETSPAPDLSNSTSASRIAADTDNNSADFAIGAPNPESSGGVVEPPTEFTGTIAEIQGTGASSEHVGDIATTEGVVTAAYPSGGFYGYVLQTPGSPETPGASDAIYVYQPSGSVDVTPGDYVRVTGEVSEYNDLTELTVAKADITDLGTPPADVVPFDEGYPTTDAARESHESELFDVSDQQFTVTDNYSTNQYAEIGLATGDKPLITPTEVADAQDAAAVAAVKADNAARGVVLDDGASINFLPFGGGDNQDIPLPWLGTDNPVRVSAQASFHEPVILDYRNDLWKFQPTHRVTDEGAGVVTFEDTRSDNAAPQDVGGDLRLATFNVLNYFPTTGEEFVESGGGTCTYYVDRDEDPVTDNRCEPEGPRGAAEAEDLERQQTKIVTAINKLDADIVSLEEIENSVKFGKDRDDAVATLVAALNAAAGGTRWAYVPSPAPDQLPATSEQDVIRTAFIYDPSTVQLVGDSEVLVGSAAFEDAREPLAQAFKPVGGGAAATFGVIVNHFKSKGSGVDDGTGQGNANPDRIAQAGALADFADRFKADRGIESLFLSGDFNAYSMEDPVQVLEGRGYTDLKSDTPDEWTYNFDSQAGSLDHVFANQAALAQVTGVDIWDINADEAVAFEYSRHNYNATDFYQPNQFRASDHDPAVIGIDLPKEASTVSAEDVTVVYSKERPRIPVTVSADGVTPTGTVTVSEDGDVLGEATLSDGSAVVVLPKKSLERGEHTLTVSYSGDDAVEPGTGTVTVTVTNPRGK